MNEVQEISGKGVERAYTLGSQFDQNSIEVIIDNKAYRIKADEIAKLIKRRTFIVEKAKKYSYLKVK